MLIKINGTIDYVGDGFLVLEQGGLGYKVILPEGSILGASGQMTLYTHEVIRDDSRELFGFFSMEALTLFWKLVSISGVGSRIAQKIVFSSSVEEVKGKIMGGDLGFLMSIPGIGKKTAQKIILELKGVLTEEPLESVDTESMDALIGLGYSRRQAQGALSGILGSSTEERVRAALKTLAK